MTNSPSKKIDFVASEFENCTFKHCQLVGQDLSNAQFVDCTFQNCDLSQSKLKNTALRNVAFEESKLMGLRFDNCNSFLLEIGFTNCILDLSSFYGLSLKDTTFSACGLREVEFVEADLTDSVFDQCQLNGAAFENTKLNGVDFRTSAGILLDPDRNSIRKAKFSTEAALGLLSKYDIEID